MLLMRDRIRIGAQPIVAPVSLAAPVGGWNARDEVDAMDPLDAITLDNFFPDVTGVTVRNGYVSHATGLGTDPVETLAQYNSGSTNKLLGACGDSIFDATASGAVGAALGTGFTNARWQWANFLGKMFLANGADTMQEFDGSTLADSTFTGVTLSTLIGVALYQQRLFFWQANSTKFWYAALNSVTGALTSYDLSAFTPPGGNLVSIATVTHDGGNGVLDFIAFIMSSGDMLLFYGNDPGNANAWQLVGRYHISPPVNIRAVCGYGADSFVTTFDDHVPLQQQLVALKVGAMAPRSKVSSAVQDAITSNPSAFGWQALYYPKGRRLIFNIPNADGTFDQHVCNTSLPKQPWCRFKGMNASCWGLLGSDLYFGGAAGVVYIADVGSDDAGSPIAATAQQAWNRGGSAMRKRMSAMRPIINCQEGAYSFAVGFDYADPAVTDPVLLDGAALTNDMNNSLTDDAGNEITVGAGAIGSNWSASAGTGTAFSFAMMTRSIAAASWYRTDYRMEVGNAL